MDLRPVDGLTAARTSRRAVLSLLGVATAWPTGLQAQDADKPARFAFLAAGGAPRPGSFSTIDAVVAGLRERGQSHIVHQSWFADGRAERLPALVQQLLQWQPDLIVTLLTPAAAAAAQATRSVPIIMDGAGDPVAAGLVQSLARPRARSPAWPRLGPNWVPSRSKCCANCAPGCAGWVCWRMRPTRSRRRCCSRSRRQRPSWGCSCRSIACAVRRSTKRCSSPGCDSVLLRATEVIE